MPEPEPVTVVMPVRNGARLIGEQLAALAAQSHPGDWRIIVADNGSTDGTVACVKAWRDRLPRLELVDAGGRRGAAHARNVAAARVQTALIAMCDADDVAAPDWLSGLVRAARDADLVGGAIAAFDTDDLPPLGWPPQDGLPVALGFLPYALGNNCCARTSTLRSLGGWNEAFVGGAEDVELSWRMQLLGHRLKFAADAVMRYRSRTSQWEVCSQYFHRGRTDLLLERNFAGHGLPGGRRLVDLRRWAWLATHCADVTVRRRRLRWLASAALAAGHLAGAR